MNYKLPFLPERSGKPRTEGLTMMMDKGLSFRQTEDFISAAGDFTDFVKFGFGTSIITNNLKEKIKIYKDANIRPYFGGTLFEAFVIRDMFDDYRKYIDEFGLDLTEVSDGSMLIPHDKKLKYISTLAKQCTVLSEVGSKVKGVVIPPESWVEMMNAELEAGSYKVIAEARESGTIGIYNSDGSVNESLINTISEKVGNKNIIWEAPNGKQQVWFNKIFGSNVNLGNIAPDIVVPLECLRLGLRGDTFFDSLPDNLQHLKQED
ncbi:MAG: phosphosulfolactate synthase [Bacteroidales bacterium]|nr:phosphosulfolactate synthase [Bacteroidales bacterium]MBN2820140.1 phosphosulfolactate synthase [Bacteroidales bacterium]